MNGDLDEVLRAREARFLKKRDLAQTCGCAVVSALLRLPRALRSETEFLAVFEAECRLLERRFETAGMALTMVETWRDADGPATLWTTPDAGAAKSLCLEAEQAGAGALMDLDVMDASGETVSRSELGLAPRPCLVCGADARICVRSGAHTVDDVAQAARALNEIDSRDA